MTARSSRLQGPKTNPPSKRIDAAGEARILGNSAPLGNTTDPTELQRWLDWGEAPGFTFCIEVETSGQLAEAEVQP